METKNEQVLKILDETEWYYKEIFPALLEETKANNLDLFLAVQYAKGSVLIKHPVIKTFKIIEHYCLPKQSADIFVFEKTRNKLYGFLIQKNLVRYGNFSENDFKQSLYPKSPFVNKTIGELLECYDIPGASNIPCVHYPV